MTSIKTSLALSLGLLTLGCVSSTKSSGAAPEAPPLAKSFNVQSLAIAPALAVPSGNTFLTAYETSQGFQNYECRPQSSDPNHWVWTLHAPSAVLLGLPEEAKTVGMHFGGVDRGLTPGPYWEIGDSRVRGKLMTSVPNGPAHIPLLLLEVVEKGGTGILSQATYIQRLETKGGVAPTGDCTPEGARQAVPYSALYVFYRKG